MEETDFVKPTEKDFENDNEEIHRLTGRHHTLSRDELRQLREATVEDIVRIDKDVARGMDLFFANQVRDSEELFAKNATKDPLYAAGAACITAVKAMLSMDQSDGDIAIERISFAITFAEELVPAGKSLFQKMGGLFRRDSAKKRLLPGEFRAKAILAASYALRGFVLVIQQTSFNNIIKGGMSLNKSYHLFKTLQTELDEVKVEKKVDSFDEVGLDSNSVCLVHLGHGCTNVALSILPPRVERLLNFLGYTHDIELGTNLVLQCWKSETLFSPFAGLFLMAINSFLPGFCPILVPQTLPLAKDLARDVLARPTMKKSLIHLWLLGRIRRLERNMTESIDALSTCLEITESGQVVESMPQLRDFAVYDQAWNFVAVGRWKECISYYALLEEKSAWSKIYYIYAQGCCYEMLAFEASLRNEEEEVRKFTEEASQAFWRAAHRSIRTVGGRTISVESFVAARLDEMFRHVNLANPNPGNKKKVSMSTDKPPNGVILRNTVPLAMLELAVLFDMLHQLPPDILESFLEMIKQTESKGVVSSTTTPLNEKTPTDASQNSLSSNLLLSPSISVLLDALKGLVLVQLSARKQEGEQLLKKTLNISSRFKGKRHTMSWITPFILYEQTSLAFAEGDVERCHKLLAQVSDINNDQVFHAVMDSKLHFAKLALHEALVKTKK